MKFDVKIDMWLRLVLYATSFMVVPMIFFVPANERFYVAGVALLNIAMILPFALIGFYELKEDHLYIRFGFIFKKIKYNDISEISESKGMSNSYALSSDRVRIRVKNKSKAFGTTEISPEDKERFIFELKRRCPLLREEF